MAPPPAPLLRSAAAGGTAGITPVPGEEHCQDCLDFLAFRNRPEPQPPKPQQQMPTSPGGLSAGGSPQQQGRSGASGSTGPASRLPGTSTPPGSPAAAAPPVPPKTQPKPPPAQQQQGQQQAPAASVRRRTSRGASGQAAGPAVEAEKTKTTEMKNAICQYIGDEDLKKKMKACADWAQTAATLAAALSRADMILRVKNLGVDLSRFEQTRANRMKVLQILNAARWQFPAAV